MKKILAKHAGEPTLIIGQYLDQIDDVAELLNIPKLTGQLQWMSASSSTKTSGAES